MVNSIEGILYDKISEFESGKIEFKDLVFFYKEKLTQLLDGSILSFTTFSEASKLDTFEGWSSKTEADKMYFDEAVKFVNKYSALSFTNYMYNVGLHFVELNKNENIYDNDQKCLKINIAEIINIIKDKIDKDTKFEFNLEIILSFSKNNTQIREYIEENIISVLNQTKIKSPGIDEFSKILCVYSYFFALKPKFNYVYFINSQSKVSEKKLTQILILKNLDFSIDPYLFQLQSIVNSNLLSQIKKASIKSAIAAIMSRNMSHNLGSHVFYYTRQNLLEIYEFEKNTNFKYTKEIKGLSWFLHYVQERQDFVANINSGDSYIFGPLNLKQDVIDEIAPDALDERHLDGYNKSNNITKNYLLENIVRSEKISRHSKENKSLADIQIVIIFKGKEFSTRDSKVDNEFYNLDFAVQGGQQSRHAFLIMLENIIRNSAKHAFKETESNNLIITIDVDEDEQENEYKISIYDNTKNADEALGTLKKSLESLKFIDESNYNIDRSNKGLKEILVSILWLKGLDFGDIENFAKKPEILMIEGKNGNIAYTFSVPSFKNKRDLKTDHIHNILKDESIDIYASIINVSKKNIEEYIEKFNNKISLESVFNELSSRIPRLLLNDENHQPNSNWMSLFNSRYKLEDSRTNLLFDRSTGKSNHDKTLLLTNGNEVTDKDKENAKVYFNNHLAKNKNNLIDSMNSIQPNNGLIYESISGANQAFNLMQKFTKSLNNSNTEDLYWNVMMNYNTKIVIVDERLAFSPSTMHNLKDDLESYINGKISIETIFQKSGLQFDILEFTKKISSTEDILEKLNYRYNLVYKFDEEINEAIKSNKETKRTNSEKVNYQLPDETIYSNYNCIPKISHDVYEKFKFQQNTFVFNLNTNDDLLTNSLGLTENPFSGYVELKKEKFTVDFFTIHIGIIDKLKEKETNMCKTTKEIIRDLLIKNKLEPKYVCVHSGRGGLNDKNDKINFIPFSILQRCFEDSKFLLSEFFYNNQYIPL